MNQIVFPKPCTEDWDQMTPEGRARFCDACGKPVHDLTEYTPEEVQALLTGEAGLACMRATIRADGQVLTRPSLSGAVLTAGVITPALSSFLDAHPVSAHPGHGAIAGTIAQASRWDVADIVATAAGVHRSTRTDGQGRYILDNLPPGSYQLDFSLGSVRWSVSDLGVAAGELTVCDSGPPRMPRRPGTSPRRPSRPSR
jgi:hypothetical protein